MDETIYVLLKVLFDFALEVWFRKEYGFNESNLSCNSVIII